jgi:hypothetical protein
LAWLFAVVCRIRSLGIDDVTQCLLVIEYANRSGLRTTPSLLAVVLKILPRSQHFR